MWQDKLWTTGILTGTKTLSLFSLAFLYLIHSSLDKNCISVVNYHDTKQHIKDNMVRISLSSIVLRVLLRVMRVTQVNDAALRHAQPCFVMRLLYLPGATNMQIKNYKFF
jgi:hypothetical protein